MTDVDVKKLAQLSRISVSDEEMDELQREIPEILAFVEQIAEAGGEVTKETGEHYNIMREDTLVDATGACGDEMREAMPETQDGYLKVRKIISQD